MKGIIIVTVAILIGMIWCGVLAAGAPPGSELDPLVSKSYVDQFVRYEVVVITSGQQLQATTSGVEIILRAGRATVIGSEAGGLVNATAGRDQGHGEQVEANNLLIVPRSDGRGISAVTDVVVMVRGGYTIK